MRHHQWIAIVITAVFIGVLGGGSAVASDLDDGMSIDDNINSYDNLGNPDQNISFIKLNAKSNAKRKQKSIDKGVISDDGSGGSGGGAMNSVVMGAGSNVKGDIIIIDESKGDKTQVVE